MTDSILGSDSPGATPIGDVSGLIPRHIHTRAELNAAEAINISKAVNKYLAARPSKRTAPFTLTWAYRLHRDMFGEVWRWAGQPRRTELNLGVPFHDIDVTLQNLLDDLAKARWDESFCEERRSAHGASWFAKPQAADVGNDRLSSRRDE